MMAYNAMSAVQKKWLCVILIVVCAFVLRGYRLFSHNLWFDEIISDLYSWQNIAKRACLDGTTIVKAMIDRIKADVLSTGYYTIVLAYSRVMGGGMALRVLSVFFSLVSLFFFYKIARFFAPDRIVIGSLLFMAISPLNIWYAQEARGYALFTACALATVYYFMRAANTQSLRSWITYLFVSTFSYCVDPMIGLLMIVIGFNAITRAGTAKSVPRAKQIIFWQAAIIVLITGIFFVRFHTSIMNSVSWVPRPSLADLSGLYALFCVGYTAPVWVYWLAGIISLSSATFGIKRLWRDNPDLGRFLALCVFLPPCALYIFSMTGHALFLGRRLLFCAPFYYLSCIYGIEALSHRAFRNIVRGLLLGCVGISLLNYYRDVLPLHSDGQDIVPGVHQRNDYRPLLRQLENDFRRGDVVLTTDIQASAIVYDYALNIWKPGTHLPAIASFGIIFYPDMLRDYEKVSLHIKNTATVFVPGDTRSPLFWPLVRVSSMVSRGNDFPVQRIYLLSCAWNEGQKNINTMAVQDYLIESGFYRAHSQTCDRCTLDVYQRGREEK